MVSTTRYVHLLGDSTLDNIHCLLNENGTNLEEAYRASIEGELKKRLDPDTQVINHAYVGFTTSSVLYGDKVGKALHKEKKAAYRQSKSISTSDPPRFIEPLSKLKKIVFSNPAATHYVVISIGGNNFRDIPFIQRILIPIAMLTEIRRVHQRYFRILDEVQSLGRRNIRPILMFQYRLDANDDRYFVYHDLYYVYKMMKIVGIFFSAVPLLSAIGIAASAAALIAHKINKHLVAVSILMSTVLLALNKRVLPLKVTKGILPGQDIAMTTLGRLMEVFYRPILERAKKDRLPILDLANTFNPYQRLYFRQIEPNVEGGKLIAEGIQYIVQHHYFDVDGSKLYSKRDSKGEFSSVENSDPNNWQVAYPSRRE